MRFLPIASFALLVLAARAEDLTIKIPPVTTSIQAGSQPVAITAWGTITRVSKVRDAEIFKLQLTADLSDLQRNITSLLKSELDRSERCGERIEIQHAVLSPADPASLLTVQLHYERSACAKAFGKQIVTRLAAGNASVPVKLTPAVEANAVRLVPEVGNIEADGSLGELLRSGPLGPALREKIRNALASSIQKSVNPGGTLPPAVQSLVTVQQAQFIDAGSGRLALVLGGELRITGEQVQLLMTQLRDRVRTQ